MDLFRNDPTHNLLPCDGTVNYHGSILNDTEADKVFTALLKNVPWRNDEAIIFGRHIITARKVAWYGDANYSYTYSGTTKEALIWNDELRALKTLVEQRTGARFNSCLLNLYHDGKEGMAWHSDDESALAKDSAIASVSFGAERKFSFKHKRTGETVSLVLENGSMLVMKDATQRNWLHCLPKSARVTLPRINLTFRIMRPEAKQKG
jgi:alkylated DNA repair dioxygenase AlkB